MANYRAVIAINEHGLMLGVGPEGRWIVSTSDGRRWSAAENRRVLLPLLERRHEDLTTLNLDLASDPPPWDDLIRFALSSWSDYWAGLALGWLEHGYPAAPFRDTLRALKDEARRTQAIRHRALRLWREASKP
ncbi:hypothetical protein [Micromonospora echinaurantiaca]|uniref:hypothetical protein n=1 Tax=Micromonospora echinaurantiaca TaxID=47857 RepID=UPI0037AAC631